MNAQELITALSVGGFDKSFELLYKTADIDSQRIRYINAVEKFSSIYPEHSDIHIYSAPGRTEIGGNHTDHQNGCVIAGAVDLDAIGITAFHDKGFIRIKSEGYDEFTVSLDDLEVRKGKSDTAEIVRGIAAGFRERGIKITGFDMYITSTVIAGSGISSSAAFENLIASALDIYCNDSKLGAVEIAKIGQYAENVYFGKKSGLMDQMASSVGGFVFIDFKSTDKPEISKVNFDFDSTGYELIITDTRGSHSDLTEDYAAVRSEMEAVAGYFGKKVLREVDEALFWEKIQNIRKEVSDRAVLRSVHFFSDNNRAGLEAQALENSNFEEFLSLVNESGESSMNLLQNLYSCRKPAEQAIPLAIMLGKRVLKGKGAIRVHGGGFAGTVQAFVPAEKVNEYISEMDRVFGENSCYKLKIRQAGGIEIK